MGFYNNFINYRKFNGDLPFGKPTSVWKIAITMLNYHKLPISI